MDSLDAPGRKCLTVRYYSGVLLRNIAGGIPVPFATPGMRPAVDVYESPDGLVVALEAPGLSLSDLEVSPHGQFLRVRGRRTGPENAIHCDRCAVHSGAFDLLIPLPRQPVAKAMANRVDKGPVRIIVAVRPANEKQESERTTQQ